MTKDELRRMIAQKRREIDLASLERVSLRIAEGIAELDEFKRANSVALYKAIGGEVILESLFSRCWELNKRTLIPVFNAQRKLYEMAEVTSSTCFLSGKYGILEPENPERLSLDGVHLVLVPGVAFSANGNRLGRGGGYYDRLLENYSGYTIGAAFDFQLVKDVPCDAHDISLHAVVTPSKTIKL